MIEKAMGRPLPGAAAVQAGGVRASYLEQCLSSRINELQLTLFATPALVLKYCFEAVRSFEDQFLANTANKGQGATSHSDQHLLRGMLVFSCSGLDSVYKHAIPIAVSSMANNAAAQKAFEQYSARTLGKTIGETDKTSLARLFLHKEGPRGYLVEQFIDELTGTSLQSVDQIAKTRGTLGIEQPHNRDSLKPAFEARNLIIHEMDMDLSTSGRGRRNLTSRRYKEMSRYCNVVIEEALTFLIQLEKGYSG